MIYYLAKLQFLLPHFLISRIAVYFGNHTNIYLKNFLIKTFVKKFDVDLSLAKRKSIEEYDSFNDFFTRHLDRNLRSIATHSRIISPADGTVLTIGKVHPNQLFQAKNYQYNLLDLLGEKKKDKKLFNLFKNGSYFTIYLSPRDYHRVHMPCAGTLLAMQYVPGRLFSVNPASLETVSNIFTRNERVIALFKTDFGYMAIVLVGAMIVGSIATAWHGVVTPPHGKREVQTWRFNHTNITLPQGSELGYFQMGSTVIALFSKDFNFNTKIIDSSIQFGQPID